MEDISALQSGKLGKGLKKFLTEEVVDKGKTKESLVVIDPHLGSCSCISHGLFFNFFISYRACNHQKTEHQRERLGGGLERRSMEGYQDSINRPPRRTGSQGPSYYELGSQSFVGSVRTFDRYDRSNFSSKPTLKIQTQVFT